MDDELSLMEPLIPLVEIDEAVFDSVDPVLIEHLVNGSSKAFRVGVREVLIVVEKDPGVVVSVMEWLEIFCVVRQEDSVTLTTPLEQLGVTRVFPKPIFRLLNGMAALSGKAFKDPANVFVEEDLRTRHCTVSLGWSDDSRTRSNAASFSASSSRSSSMCA